MPDEFLTVREIAELLKLNDQTVRNMIDRGEIPAVRVGSRSVRVMRSDLDAFLGERRRITKKSDRRIAFEDAMGVTNKALRGKDHDRSVEALRSLAESALALAVEMAAAPSTDRPMDIDLPPG